MEWHVSISLAHLETHPQPIIRKGRETSLRGRSGKFTLLIAPHHLSDGLFDSRDKNSPCQPPPQQYFEWLLDEGLINIYSHPAKHAALSKMPVKVRCIFSATSPNHEAMMLIGPADDLEEQVSPRLEEGNISQFIEH
jgi:hypothetical protein